MEYADLGCLDRVVKNYRPLSYNLIRNYCLDICKGLKYLHEELSVAVVHRDIKLKNILVFGKIQYCLEDSICKIGDFGLATSMIDQQSVEMLKGTLKWMAPELLLGHPHTPGSDIYAFGSVLYCLITGDRKLPEYHEQNLEYRQ